jgi:hypothetical protein
MIRNKGSFTTRSKIEEPTTRSFEEHKEETNSTFCILITTSQRRSTSPIFLGK